MRQEKEKLQKYTIGYLIAMVVIFVVVLIGIRNPGLKTVALIATVVVFVALIVMQWRKVDTKSSEEATPSPVAAKPVGKVTTPSPQKKTVKAKTPTKKEDTLTAGIATKTGAVCMEPGEYHCSKHAHRTVVMDEGKRFPPCRGDKKGHSAIWVLDNEA